MGSSAENLAAQAASTVESNFNILGGLPQGSARRALDPEVAREGGKVVGEVGRGMKVILSDGSQVVYEKPQEKLRIPDWSQIESIKHYFGPRGYTPYPAWFYHPTLDPVLVKDAKEAAEYGIVYRSTTDDERMRFGRNETWDWEQGCEWRPHPLGKAKINFADHAGTKNLITGSPDPSRIQADMVATVVAAVTQVLKGSPAASAAPAAVDPKEWEEFVKFQAWKKANEVVAQEIEAVSSGGEAEAEGAEVEHSGNVLTPEQDRILWEAEANRLGIKVKKTWTLEQLRAEVEAKLNAS